MSALDPLAKKREAKPEREFIEKPPKPSEFEPKKEAGLEIIRERPAKELEKLPSAEEEIITLPPLPPPAVFQKSPVLKQIEDILEEDLSGIYFSLPLKLQRDFKTKGEQTASKIEKLFLQAKIKVKEILKLIVEWLKIIPGLNRFFLEQEAKIKTDKIIKLKK